VTEQPDSDAGHAPKRNAVLIGAEDAESAIVRRQLQDLINVVAVERSPARGLALVRERAPVVVVLFLDHEPDAILGIAREAGIVAGCAPVVVTRTREPEKTSRAIRLGAGDVAALDADDEVRRAVQKVMTASPETRQQGRLVAVFSAKGGSGATTIATNLAGSLLAPNSGAEKPTVILDMDFQMGDVLSFLDVAGRYSWKDLGNNIHRLDRELLFHSLTAHPCGLRVVSQTDHPEDADDVEPGRVAEALALVRRHFDYVVVDGLRDFRESTLVALDAADIVIVTVTQDVPALKNANRCLAILKRLGYDRNIIKLVLNRYTKDKGVDREAISDALGFEVSAVVSNDFPTVVAAVNEGRLLTELAPRARVTRDIASLVTLVHGMAPEPERRGMFSRWRKA
jgi:pilus assembly protein CpaE